MFQQAFSTSDALLPLDYKLTHMSTPIIPTYPPNVLCMLWFSKVLCGACELTKPHLPSYIPLVPLFDVLMLINISCLSFSLVVGFGMCKKLGFIAITRNFEDHFGWLNISTLKDIYFSIFHGEVGVDIIFLYNGYVYIVLN